MSLVDNGSPWECHSGRNLGSIAIRHRLYMVGIRPVSLDCTIYMLGAFAIEVSHLIGTCTCSLFKTRHNTSFPLVRKEAKFLPLKLTCMIPKVHFQSGALVKRNETETKPKRKSMHSERNDLHRSSRTGCFRTALVDRRGSGGGSGAGTAGAGTCVEALGTGDSCSSEAGPRECAGSIASTCGPVGLSRTRVGWTNVTCVLSSSAGAGMR